jgi:hypothetical protein
MRQRHRSAAVFVVTVGMLGLAAPALANDHLKSRQHVKVTTDGSTVAIDDATVEAGLVSFEVSTSVASQMGSTSSVTMIQPKQGVSLDQVFADFAEEFSNDPPTAAKGTSDLTRDILVFGLANVVPDHPEVVTERLGSGTYYLLDLTNPPAAGTRPALTPLTVSRTGEKRKDHGRLSSQIRVRATSDDRFLAPSSWPHGGTYTFLNVSDTLHFMAISPIKVGTTDADIQAYYDSGVQTPPPFALSGPAGGNDVVSPGRAVQVSYDLPPGTYVLLCFVADDKTGAPHSLMGMHKVITLI